MPVATWLGHGRFGSFGRFGFLGRFGSFGGFGSFGIILLLPELAQGTIGPEGVCETCGERGREEKSFLQNEPIMSFRINKRIGFVLGLIGFVWLKKPLESQPRPLIGGCRRGRMEHRQECLSLPDCRSLPVSELSEELCCSRNLPRGKIEPEDVYEA